MISLKRLMHTNVDEMVDAYRRTIVLLMQSIALHAVEGETDEYDGFRRTMNELTETISEHTAPMDVFVAGGTVNKAMFEYGRRTSLFIKAQSIELQAMIGMLTRTMSDISSGSERSMERLHEIERKLAKTAVIEDIRILKTRMSECLETVREECTLQKQDTTQLIGGIRSGLLIAEEKRVSLLEQRDDPVTGLPSRAQAEIELKKASASGRRIFAGIFIVDRMQPIRSRFGHPIADKVMLFFAQKLTEALGPADKIYKWGEGSYMAIMERTDSLESARRELGQHLFQKWEKPFELGSRSIVLPISASWLLIDSSGRVATKAIADIDAFVAKTVPAM